MNIFKSESLQFLRRTMRLHRISTPFVSLSAASLAAASVDKPDDEALRKMAEELQEKINRRNLDYGIGNTDADADQETPTSIPPQSSAASSVADLSDPSFRLEAQESCQEMRNADDIGKLIEADIAQWIAERRDIAELGQICKGSHTDCATQDCGYQNASEADRQPPSLLPHWREVRASALAAHRPKQDESN